MRVGEQLREIWRQATRHGRQAGSGRKAELMAGAADADAERKTLALPAILSPVQFPGRLLPKPTPVNLRRFAETPVVRRAINVIKDRIAAMDWQVRVRRGVRPGDLAYAERKLRALRRTLEEPNAVDSFRTLIEQVIEDALTGGFGAIEMEPTGDGERPAMLWAVDGASIRINAKWDGDPETPRYAQVMPGQLESGAVDLRDDQLMYVRMNPRSFTPFGLGPLEVAFETVNQFLSAHRFAGKLAANAVAQYALWLNEATPAQHDRLIRWWQDEIEGTGRVPLISTEQKPEVLRFAAGHGCGYAAGLAGVSDPHGGQCVWFAAADAGTGGGCEPIDRRGDGRRGIPRGDLAAGDAAGRAHYPRSLRQVHRLAGV